jgi:hypothetical protein
MKKYIRFTGGLILLVGLFVFHVNKASGDIVISNGTSMKVSAGTSVVVADNVELETGAGLSNNGTVRVGGDFSNSGTASLGPGEIIFNGSAAQAIGGTTVSTFGDLTLDNAAGLALNVGAAVGGTLTLSSGVLSIGANNLTFGESASAVAGTLSASNMILADGAGQVRKSFPDGTSDPASFLFPVGSNDGTAEYSPIAIDFNSSTFASAYVGVNVTPSVEPNNSSIDTYLGRYWTIENFGISAYTYNLTATYVDADIVGTEADLSGGLYHGTGWYVLDPANAGSNTFSGSDIDDDGNATGVEFRIFSDLKVFVQGAYNSTTNEMTTSLNGTLPLDAATAYTHIGYTGSESVAVIPSADIVDWILVEVRDAATPAGATTPGDTVAGFLMKDGSIVSIDGVSPLKFKTLINDNAYFVMIHRNHLAVMTATSPGDVFGNYQYDFTDANTKAYGTNAMYQVDTSPVAYGLFAGETNLSGIITNSDKVPIDLNIDYNGYHIGDCNFSGIVTNADKVFIDLNMDEVGQLPN